ncbi:hypothetical protein OU790_01975, partial [Ruegeria sp. NA]|nr:hypothetical protein [Ruegeria sp. NA]
MEDGGNMQDFGEFAARERLGWADESIVSAYVRKFGPVTDYAAQELINRGSPKGMSVLDLCCGQGALTAMLSDAAFSAVFTPVARPVAP